MSIGDVFGGQLQAFMQGQDAGDSDEVSGPSSPGDEAAGASGGMGGAPVDQTLLAYGAAAGSPGRISEVEQQVRSIIGELLEQEPASVDWQRPLAELGVDGLALWAVVAEIERQSGVSFRDEEALGWRAPSNIVTAVLAARAAEASSVD